MEKGSVSAESFGYGTGTYAWNNEVNRTYVLEFLIRRAKRLWKSMRERISTIQRPLSQRASLHGGADRDEVVEPSADRAPTESAPYSCDVVGELEQ